MGIMKNFRYEKVTIQFRGEFFNIFNRTRLSNPVSNMSTSRFGGITAAEDPRIGQLALKISF
jgi:hypothetical protein